MSFSDSCFKSNSDIKCYKVGGAIRDNLLNLPVKETDWVVVGATPEWMCEQGFKPVGSQFPVFIHPNTKEEYALARTERKVGHGYAGFEFYTATDVTLEQDLIRRDITINAMAMDRNGTIIDPYNGLDDLNNRVIRHLSNTFVEDPLRVLRVARFYTCYANFSINQETMVLMAELVSSGELAYLSFERIWVETCKAMSSNLPWRFFEVLNQCGALSELMLPLADNLDKVVELLKQSIVFESPIRRYAIVLAYCLSKENIRIAQFCRKQKLPNDLKVNVEKLVRGLPYFQPIANLTDKPETAEQIVKFFSIIDGWRQPDNIPIIIQQSTIINQFNTAKIPSKLQQLLLTCFEHTNAVKAKPFVKMGLSGKDIAKAIYHERVEKTHQILNDSRPK